MEKEIGTIVEVDANQVMVEMRAGENCSHCSAKGICSALGSATRTISIPTNEHLYVGDQVWLCYKSNSRILAALLIFTVPLIFLIAGYVIATANGGSAGLGYLASLLGLIIGFVLIRMIDHLLEQNSNFVPTLTRIRPDYYPHH